MGRTNRSTKLDDPGNAAAFRVDPFAALPAALPQDGPATAGHAASTERDLQAPAGPGAGGTRIRAAGLRYGVERKGHGGKAVTVVRGLEGLSGAEQAALLQAARQALGVGGAFADGILQLQGDQRDRARAWLEKRFPK